MRYFFDTEFIEDGTTIDLISIGIVAEDGREYYALNRDCCFSKASDWVEKNILNPIGITRDLGPDILQNASPNTLNSYLQMKQKEFIAADIVDFMGGFSEKGADQVWLHQLREDSPSPEIWAYYADYDWVAFCQLFGKMIDLPKRFPMYCRDLKQECDRLGNPELPIQQSREHHALEDARWTRDCWYFLRNQKD